jgi:DeoR/GlpR family transcriptional regulator of sugar metabolism
MSKTEHFVSERQAFILSELETKGRVIAQELAQTFSTSEDTIRRDLREMAARGECERVYGGALKTTGLTTPLQTRLTEKTDRKALLAQTVVSLLSEGMVVFIDAGSTNLAVARQIPQDLRLTAITNTPIIAAELASKSGVDLIVIGGKVDANVGASIDATALRQLEQVRPDLCILGACGVTLEHGLAADIYEDAVFKRLACQASAKILAAITREKLGHKAAFNVCDLGDPLSLILEHQANPVFSDALIARGIEIHMAASASLQPVIPNS